MVINPIAVTRVAPCDEVILLSKGSTNYDDWCKSEARRIIASGGHAAVQYVQGKNGNKCYVARPRREINTSNAGGERRQAHKETP
jgi:hypothetical protein